MPYDLPVPSEPIFESELPPELRQKFLELFFDAHAMHRTHEDDESVTAAATLLHQQIQEEVLAHPVLARTIHKDMREWSLLEVFCEEVGSAGIESIRFLIETNPHALLWYHRTRYEIISPIHSIAKSGWGGDLLSWIVESYPWVFESELCQNRPPHLDLVRCYVHGKCDKEAVRRFYELYPQGLREADQIYFLMSPLTVFLGGSSPDADLFIWMAKQYPKAVLKKEAGNTLLNTVCCILAAPRQHGNRIIPDTCTPDMAKICRFLISEHPVLIRKKGHVKGLPIHMLVRYFNRPMVQEMAILLLKAYPECMHARVSKWQPDLSAEPFIQQVFPLVVEELEIDQEIALLTQASQNMAQAAANAPSGSTLKSSLFGCVSEVFCSWANLRIFNVLSTRKHQIQECATDVCRRLEGDDVIYESDDDYECWYEDPDRESESDEDDFPDE